MDKETVYNKLTFLGEKGFSIISDICDRDLRNSIAHMNFIVFTNGSVVYENGNGKGIKITKDELDTKIERLVSICQGINLSFEQFYNKKYRFAEERP